MRLTSKSGIALSSTMTSASDSTFQLFSPASTQIDSKTKAAPAKRASASGSQTTKAVESAVYGQIRAMRALGVTSVSTDKIAKSLSIPRSLVDAAVKGMRDRGVKVSA